MFLNLFYLSIVLISDYKENNVSSFIRNNLATAELSVVSLAWLAGSISSSRDHVWSLCLACIKLDLIIVQWLACRSRALEVLLIASVLQLLTVGRAALRVQTLVVFVTACAKVGVDILVIHALSNATVWLVVVKICWLVVHIDTDEACCGAWIFRLTLLVILSRVNNGASDLDDVHGLVFDLVNGGLNCIHQSRAKESTQKY